MVFLKPFSLFFKLSFFFFLIISPRISIPFHPRNYHCRPTVVRLLLSMNPSTAFPKAAALPARLLRTQRQYSKQTSGNSVHSSNQTRNYHATVSASPARRLREGVCKRKESLVISARVCHLYGLSRLRLLINMLFLQFTGLPHYLSSFGRFRPLQGPGRG